MLAQRRSRFLTYHIAVCDSLYLDKFVARKMQKEKARVDAIVASQICGSALPPHFPFAMSCRSVSSPFSISAHAVLFFPANATFFALKFSLIFRIQLESSANSVASGSRSSSCAPDRIARNSNRSIGVRDELIKSSSIIFLFDCVIALIIEKEEYPSARIV